MTVGSVRPKTTLVSKMSAKPTLTGSDLATIWAFLIATAVAMLPWVWDVLVKAGWNPLPLFDKGSVHPETPRLIEAVAQRVEQGGIDAWYDLDPAELLGAEAGRYAKVTDTLDVWFDSGVSHAAVLERLEGVEILANVAVGYDNIDVPELTRRGVLLTNKTPVSVSLKA